MNVASEWEVWCCLAPQLLPAASPVPLRPVAKANLLLAFQQAATPPWGLLLGVEGPTCLTLATAVRQLAPATRLVLVVPDLAAAGPVDASGLVAASGTAAELAACLAEVLKGHHYLSPTLAPPPANLDAKMFTERELEVLLQLAHGQTRSLAIGETLHLSPRTVDTHKDHLMEKLGINCRDRLYWFAGHKQAAIFNLAKLIIPGQLGKLPTKIGELPS
jgi:DNA-binding NarL/FixJ family response regulator